MKVYDFDPRSQPDEVLKAIGLVVLEANELEATIKMGLASLLKADQKIAHITFQSMNFGQAFDLLKLLAEVLIDQSTQDSAEGKRLFLASIAKCKAAMDERNYVVHSFRFLDQDDGQTFISRMRVGKSGVSLKEAVTPSLAGSVADMLRDARHDLFRQFIALRIL